MLPQTLYGYINDERFPKFQICRSILTKIIVWHFANDKIMQAKRKTTISSDIYGKNCFISWHSQKNTKLLYLQIL